VLGGELAADALEPRVAVQLGLGVGVAGDPAVAEHAPHVLPRELRVALELGDRLLGPHERVETQAGHDLTLVVEGGLHERGDREVEVGVGELAPLGAGLAELAVVDDDLEVDVAVALGVREPLARCRAAGQVQGGPLAELRSQDLGRPRDEPAVRVAAQLVALVPQQRVESGLLRVEHALGDLVVETRGPVDELARRARPRDVLGRHVLGVDREAAAAERLRVLEAEGDPVAGPERVAVRVVRVVGAVDGQVAARHDRRQLAEQASASALERARVVVAGRGDELGERLAALGQVGVALARLPALAARAIAAVLADVGAGVVLAHRLAADPRLVLERQAGAEIDRQPLVPGRLGG
jgi:hypothetical protein